MLKLLSASLVTWYGWQLLTTDGSPAAEIAADRECLPTILLLPQLLLQRLLQRLLHAGPVGLFSFSLTNNLINARTKGDFSDLALWKKTSNTS